MEAIITKEKNSLNRRVEIKKRKALLRNVEVLIIKVIFIILLLYITFFYIFGLTRMSNIEMRPTIEPGSLVIYYRLDKDYHVGDVVTFRKDGKRYVLRIVATQNQTLSLDLNNEFITNDGNEQHQTYLKNVIPESSKITYPYKVGNNQVFVVGDYRIESEDSRMFGAIDISIIDGKVISLLQTKDI